MKTLKLLSALTLAALITGCAGGAASEKDTPLADIQAKAAAADQAELEATVADYKSTIADWQKEAEAKLAEATAAAKEAVKDMSFEDLADAFKDEAAAMQKDIKALQERLAVYAAELEKRVKGSGAHPSQERIHP